LKKRKVH